MLFIRTKHNMPKIKLFIRTKLNSLSENQFLLPFMSYCIAYNAISDILSHILSFTASLF